MSIPLLRTLVAVSLNSDLSVTELADMIGIPQQSASRYVAVLQGRYQTPGSTNVFADEPLLAHKASATDLRRYELVLTPHGTARINAILNAIYSRGNSE
jgi:DNA-binding MarR family transcriptional regulator